MLFLNVNKSKYMIFHTNRKQVDPLSLLIDSTTLREESSQTNVILQYKLLAATLSAVCSVIQQSWYVLHVNYTLYDGKYDCKINTH